MKLYLVSKNTMISKLVHLSSQKLGLEVVEADSLDTSVLADIVLIDDECFSEDSFNAYKAANTEAKFGQFCDKAVERNQNFSVHIQKPFLPTDLVKTLSEMSGIPLIEKQRDAMGILQDDVLSGENNDSSGLNLDDNLDFSSLDDLNLDSLDNNAESGDEMLDFGGDDGESLDAPLDFGGDDGLGDLNETKEADNKNLDDISIDTQESQGTKTQILDENEVDAIKDLLADSADSKGDNAENLDFDLNKELESIKDDKEMVSDDKGEAAKEETSKIENEEIDFSDVAGDLGELSDFGISSDSNIKDSAAKGVDSIENKDNINESIDFSDLGMEFDGFGDKEKADSSELESSEAAEIKEEIPQDLEIIDKEKSQTTQQTIEPQAQDNLELESLENDNVLSDSVSEAEANVKADDFDFTMDENDEQSLKDGEAKIDAAGLESDLESAKDNKQEIDLDLSNFELDRELEAKKAQEPQENSSELSLDVDSLAQDLVNSPTNENSKSFEEALREDSTFEQNAESSESVESEAKEINIDDSFDTLSEEGLSEALGEPVKIAPNPTPIVAPQVQDSTKAQLPSAIKADSIEALIATLQTMQTQNLKELLSGATINISIQFPTKEIK
ncbi:MAG: hypothetical protein PUB96_06600 [Helicobacteraceae bacterium]|nr:hypothetical protein [Helicobacteraceae bacterium]